MNSKLMSLMAWLLFGLIAGSVAAGLIILLVFRSSEYSYPLDEGAYSIATVGFAFVGALIITRQPRNAIGWLMMLPGLAFTVLVDTYLEPSLSESFVPPESPPPLFLIILWFSIWNWTMLLLLPIMFVMVLFPTGRPLSRRWGWVNYLGLVIVAVFFFGATFGETLSPSVEGIDWTIRNPIGFLPLDSGDDNPVAAIITVGLLAWVLLSATALFVRFKNARGVEREQIKWLFFACAIYAVGMITAILIEVPPGLEKYWSLLGGFTLLAIPVGIAIAILRYRLYDINLIIRKTLVYGAITGLLALIYYGSVVVLQSLVENLTGAQSPVVIVISTLAIVVLFNPLRSRIQDFIDRRFYRQKYDAERALAHFADTVRDEVDMDKLTATLLVVVKETMQPEQVSVWLARSYEGWHE